MPKGAGIAWKPIDADQLSTSEAKAFNVYRSAVEKKESADKREKARQGFIDELSKRLKKNKKLPEDQDLTVMYNKRNLFIGFVEKKKAVEYFDIGNP